MDNLKRPPCVVIIEGKKELRDYKETRIQVDLNDDILQLKEKMSFQRNIKEGRINFQIAKRGSSRYITCGKSLSELGIEDGTMLDVFYSKETNCIHKQNFFFFALKKFFFFFKKSFFPF